MKVTRNMLEARVQFLNRNLNRPTGYASAPPAKFKTFIGHFHLEASSSGDGWTRYSLLETVNEGGGVNSLFSGNNQDMWAYLRGVDDALRLKMFPAVASWPL